MNLLYLLVCLVFSSCVKSQPSTNSNVNVNQNSGKLSKDFNGGIDYSDNYIKAIFSHDSCGSVLVSQQWTFKNGYSTIKTFDPIDSISFTSIPLKFVKKGNSLYIAVSGTEYNTDTIEQFKINRKDTLNSFADFRLTTLYKKEQAKMESTYIGDTTLSIQNTKYDCYRFEIFSDWLKSFPGPSLSKKIIYIDKKSLIPVQEDYLFYYKRHFCIPQKQWFLWRQVAIEKIY